MYFELKLWGTSWFENHWIIWLIGQIWGDKLLRYRHSAAWNACWIHQAKLQKLQSTFGLTVGWRRQCIKCRIIFCSKWKGTNRKTSICTDMSVPTSHLYHQHLVPQYSATSQVPSLRLAMLLKCEDPRGGAEQGWLPAVELGLFCANVLGWG